MGQKDQAGRLFQVEWIIDYRRIYDNNGSRARVVDQEKEGGQWEGAWNGRSLNKKVREWGWERSQTITCYKNSMTIVIVDVIPIPVPINKHQTTSAPHNTISPPTKPWCERKHHDGKRKQVPWLVRTSTELGRGKGGMDRCEVTNQRRECWP